MGYLVGPLQRAKGLLDGAKCKALENKVTKGAVLSFSRWETEAEGVSWSENDGAGIQISISYQESQLVLLHCPGSPPTRSCSPPIYVRVSKSLRAQIGSYSF